MKIPCLSKSMEVRSNEQTLLLQTYMKIAEITNKINSYL